MHTEETFSIAKARFLPDEFRTWSQVIKLERPAWLDIYRQFPLMHSKEDAAAARGTLVVSDDEKWLREHIWRVVAVVYVLGAEDARWKVPAEAFQYSSFLASSTTHDLVTIHTKSGGKIEDINSLQLYPPLELRGVSNSFRVNLSEQRNAELVRRFDANPYDRLVVACYHLFRSQFDNPFTSPVEQDYSAHCACLEAALDIEGPDYSKDLADKLADLYQEHDSIKRWVKGLYTSRSVFNHGISHELLAGTPDDRLAALNEFKQRPLNWDVLRKVCLDVIQRQLIPTLGDAKKALSLLLSPTHELLTKFFHSDETWLEIEKLFSQTKAVDVILGLDEPGRDDCIETCCAFINRHRWQTMKKKADEKKVCRVLKAMAAIIGELAKGRSDSAGDASAHSLFEAANKLDHDALEAWAANHVAWTKSSMQDFESVIRAAASHTAQYFCKWAF